MRIAVFGAGGAVGGKVVAEALARGHEVTAVVRDPLRAKEISQATVVAGDATRVTDTARLTEGHDVVIGATRPPDGRERELVTTTRALLDGAARTGVRLLLVGGAATLTTPNGNTVLDDPAYLPAAAREIARACVEQLAVCHAESTVDWTYLSPPALLAPGKRTGHYRLGRDNLVTDADGVSTISVADLAVVLLDEAERPKHRGTRFTAAY